VRQIAHFERTSCAHVQVRVRGAPTGRGAARRVAAAYAGGLALCVSLDGKPLMEVPRLFSRITVDDSTWTLDGDHIVVTMAKAEPRAWAALALPGSAGIHL
jgi:hypothetical protein